MKTLTLMVLLCSSYFIKAQENKLKNCSQYYAFGGSYIDLETLEAVELEPPVTDFKQCSDYKERFETEKGPVFGSKAFFIAQDEKKGIYNFRLREKNERVKTLAGWITMKAEEDAQGTVLELTTKEGKVHPITLPYGAATCNLLLNGDWLYLANYSSIATGSSLYAFHLKTGKIAWTAEVKQLNRDHSKYHNEVILSLYKDVLIMEGQEHAGAYVQFFEAQTGKRLAVFGDFL